MWRRALVQRMSHVVSFFDPTMISSTIRRLQLGQLGSKERGLGQGVRTVTLHALQFQMKFVIGINVPTTNEDCKDYFVGTKYALWKSAEGAAPR